MNDIILALISIFGIIVIYNIIVILLLKSVRKKIISLEGEIIDLFYAKVNKIPSMVEIMRRYTKHPDIFEDIIYLHKMGIIYNIQSIYDLLDLNHRIQREFQFLMKLSAKIPELHKDGNFLYIRNYVIFYENSLEKKIGGFNHLLHSYNRLIKIKNLSIFGLIVPIKEKTAI